MALTTEQKATLKADILATPAALAFYDIGDQSGLAQFYNDPASPSFFVWRTSVFQDEITQNGFDWLRVDNLSVGKARIWEWMFGNAERAFNPSKANIRSGIQECWKGTAPDLAVQAAVFGHCQRPASRIEKVFATGAGTSVVNGVGPATMGYEGPVSYTELIGI